MAKCGITYNWIKDDGEWYDKDRNLYQYDKVGFYHWRDKNSKIAQDPNCGWILIWIEEDENS